MDTQEEAVSNLGPAPVLVRPPKGLVPNRTGVQHTIQMANLPFGPAAKGPGRHVRRPIPPSCFSTCHGGGGGMALHVANTWLGVGVGTGEEMEHSMKAHPCPPTNRTILATI